jgi:hypothetical protein
MAGSPGYFCYSRFGGRNQKFAIEPLVIRYGREPDGSIVLRNPFLRGAKAVQKSSDKNLQGLFVFSLQDFNEW